MLKIRLNRLKNEKKVAILRSKTNGFKLENYETNDFELEALESYFHEFVKDRFYFRIRTLAINFISDNTSLNYKQASQTENLLGMIMRFSKITTKARRENIIKKYNDRVFQIIKNVK